MPRLARSPEHLQKILESNRKNRFDRIADPLWVAIAKGHHQEVARLQGELRKLIAKQEDRQFN